MPQTLLGREEDIGNVRPGKGRANFKFRPQFGRYVLEAVHCKIDLPAQQSLLELLGENALVDDGVFTLAELAQLQIRAFVPDRADDLDAALHPGGTERGAGHVRLGESEFAPAGS